MKVQLPDSVETVCYKGIALQVDANGVVETDDETGAHLVEAFGAVPLKPNTFKEVASLGNEPPKVPEAPPAPQL